MLTRIKKNPSIDRIEYDVNIDFDEASREWRSNKLSMDNGHFKYICGEITKTGSKCNNKLKKDCNKCHIHYNKTK